MFKNAKVGDNVWDYYSTKIKRHFSHFTQDGKIACFKDGKSYRSNNEETAYEIK